MQSAPLPGALLTLLLCLIAALYPAWRAAGIRPIHALRRQPGAPDLAKSD